MKFLSLEDRGRLAFALGKSDQSHEMFRRTLKVVTRYRSRGLQLLAEEADLSGVRYWVEDKRAVVDFSTLIPAAKSGDMTVIAYTEARVIPSTIKSKYTDVLLNTIASGKPEAYDWALTYTKDKRDYVDATIYITTAISAGQLVMTQHLLAKGNRINLDECLRIAISLRNNQIVRWLVDKGADIKGSDVALAVANTLDPIFIENMLLLGINQNCRSALHIVARRGRLDILRIYHKYKANLIDTTLFECAIYSKNAELVYWLIQLGTKTRVEVILLPQEIDTNLAYVRWLMTFGIQIISGTPKAMSALF